ncbi:hypothetical protein FXO38_27777 [Capsicum annuum]|nr:hypothetical protein FXO38_27777 [Capsicum annuum]
MCIADPVNGIFCICQTPLGDVLTLWNPAMRQSMVVELSKFKGPDMQFLVSVGLAFDFRNNDFLVLRIFSILKITGDALSQVEFELHPMKSPSGYWKKKTCEEYFYIDKPTCDVIVKGEPYWLAYFTSFFVAGKYEALVHFNVVELELEWWPLPFVEAVENNLFPVNFQDSVGCLRNGEIVAEIEDKVLFYDPYPCVFTDISIVGPLKGYICLFHPIWGDVVTIWNQRDHVTTLWNEPEEHSRMVKLFEAKSPQEYILSVGSAFDSFKKDLLILRIICSSTIQN